jgi:hypothetical protein
MAQLFESAESVDTTREWAPEQVASDAAVPNDDASYALNTGIVSPNTSLAPEKAGIDVAAMADTPIDRDAAIEADSRPQAVLEVAERNEPRITGGSIEEATRLLKALEGSDLYNIAAWQDLSQTRFTEEQLSRVETIMDDVFLGVLDDAQEAAVQDNLWSDRENLFSLADQVLEAEESRQWPLWVVDETGGFFVARFLQTAQELDDRAPNEMPQVTHIANSRDVYHAPKHQRAVLDHLSQYKSEITGRNVLYISEYSKDGYAAAHLCEPLRALGVSAIDAAILNYDYPSGSHFIRPPTDKPDTVFKGQPYTQEPKFWYGILKDAVGLENQTGQAEPVVVPGAVQQLHFHVRGQVDKLALEYSLRRRQQQAA